MSQFIDNILAENDSYILHENAILFAGKEREGAQEREQKEEEGRKREQRKGGRERRRGAPDKVGLLYTATSNTINWEISNSKFWSVKYSMS